MAAPISEERNLKIKALREAFIKLKENSTGLKNLAITSEVLSAANSSDYSNSFKTKISRATLMQPKTAEFIALKKDIDDFKIEHRKRKSIVSDATKEKIDELNLIIDNNTIDIAVLVHDLEESITRNEQKDKTIQKLRKERDDLYAKLREKKL